MRALKALGSFFGNVVGMIVGVLILGLLVYGATWVVGKQEDLEGRPDPLQPAVSKEDQVKAGVKLIATYCEYGAVSRAQLEGCYFHVHVDEIEGRDTNAADWARGDLEECLADAGPFCGVAYREKIEDRIDSKQLPADELSVP